MKSLRERIKEQLVADGRPPDAEGFPTEGRPMADIDPFAAFFQNAKGAEASAFVTPESGVPLERMTARQAEARTAVRIRQGLAQEAARKAGEEREAAATAEDTLAQIEALVAGLPPERREEAFDRISSKVFANDGDAFEFEDGDE